jgi:hypothetical protein
MISLFKITPMWPHENYLTSNRQNKNPSVIWTLAPSFLRPPQIWAANFLSWSHPSGIPDVGPLPHREEWEVSEAELWWAEEPTLQDVLQTSALQMFWACHPLSQVSLLHHSHFLDCPCPWLLKWHKASMSFTIRNVPALKCIQVKVMFILTTYNAFRCFHSVLVYVWMQTVTHQTDGGPLVSCNSWFGSYWFRGNCKS